MRVKASTELEKKQRKSLAQLSTKLNDEQIENSNRKIETMPSKINDDNSLDDENSLNTNKTNPKKHCDHLSKSINNVSKLKNILKQSSLTLGECTTCVELKRKSNDFKFNKDTTIWVCLYCGHQGCDRSSEHQHAYKHYKTPRSSLHCVCLNISTWSIWCYECDDEIFSGGKRVDEIINCIKKISSNPIPQVDKFETQNEKNYENHQSKLFNFNQSRKSWPYITNNKISANIQINHTINKANKVVGLNNLGNSCFFNAVLQNLAQTPNLENLLYECVISKDKKEILQIIIENNCSDQSEISDNDNTKNSNLSKINNKDKNLHFNRKMSKSKAEELIIDIGDASQLTYNLYNVIKEMNSFKASVISPGSLFSLLCKKVPSFRGHQQQDSHELLRHLLDAIKLDEIKRRQAGILSALNINNSKPIDDVLRQKIKLYGRLVNFTIIDSLFGGSLLSTVICEQCKTCSQNIEPFLDLSLPIADEKTAHNILTQNFNAPIIEDLRDSPNYISKHKLKKQNRFSKTSKKNQHIKQQMSNKSLDNDTQPTNIGFNEQQSLTSKESDDENDLNYDQNFDKKNEINSDCDDDESQISSSPSSMRSISDSLSIKSFDKSINETISNQYKLEATQCLSPRTMSISIDENDTNCTLQSCLYRFTSPELLTGTNKFGCENCTRLYYKQNKYTNKDSIKTIYTQAIKQYLICELPCILTIHLKRFQQHGYRLEKLNKHVSFPLELDMSPYTSKMCINAKKSNSHQVLYSLYGIVEHSGRLNGGHYTAYVKSRHKQNLEEYLIHKRLTILEPTQNESDSRNNNRDLIYTLSNATQHNASFDSDGTSANRDSTWYYISDSQVTEVSEAKILKLQAYMLFYERKLSS